MKDRAEPKALYDAYARKTRNQRLHQLKSNRMYEEAQQAATEALPMDIEDWGMHDEL